MGVGVQKAGTSWWYEQLVTHPDVVRPPSGHKELRYFSRFATSPFTDADAETYHRLFPRPPGAQCGEWTPSYLSDHWIPPLLGRAAPDTKLLVLLRDPVERYVSGIAQAESRGRTATLADHRDAFTRGCYATALERLLAWFPRKRVLVLQYERCRVDAAAQLRRTFEFLGLDPDHRPPDLARPVHATTRPKKTPDEDLREVLALAYGPELALLAQRFPDVDLGLWPSAAPRR